MADRLLLVTSPLLHGPDVLAVQRRLHALGFEPGTLDGVYGRRRSGPCGRSRRRRGIGQTASSGRRPGRRSQRPAGAAAGKRDRPARACRGAALDRDARGPARLEPHAVRGLVRARRRALVQHLRQLLLRRRRRNDDRRRASTAPGARRAAAPTSRPRRPGSAPPADGSAAVTPSPATSRSTTGTAGRPTTSASSSSAGDGGAFTRDRGQHGGRKRLRRRRGDAARPHARRRRRIRPPHISRTSRERRSQNPRLVSARGAPCEERRRPRRTDAYALVEGSAVGRRAGARSLRWRNRSVDGTASGNTGAAAKGSVFTGYAFDACNAPSTDALSAWLQSPYRALGIYIGGVNRACSNAQPLRRLGRRRRRHGLEPDPALRRPSGALRRRPRPCEDLPHARREPGHGRGRRRRGRRGRARRSAPGSPIYFDMEGYARTTRPARRPCRPSSAAWVDELHALGYLAGVYGSAASDDPRPAGARGDRLLARRRLDRRLERQRDRLRQPVRVRHPLDEPPAAAPVPRRASRDLGRRDDRHRLELRRRRRRRLRRTPSRLRRRRRATPHPVQSAAGSVTAVDGIASVTWPLGAFTQSVVVSLTPALPSSPPDGFGSGGYGVQLQVQQTVSGSPTGYRRAGHHPHPAARRQPRADDLERRPDLASARRRSSRASCRPARRRATRATRTAPFDIQTTEAASTHCCRR